MNKLSLPHLQVSQSIYPNYTHQAIDRAPFIDYSNYQNRSFDQLNTDSCQKKYSLSNSLVWYRLYRTPTGSSYRRSRFYNDNDVPNNNLDFRLRTCYDHAQETFASKARTVVQPITISPIQNNISNFHSTVKYPFKIVNERRKEHFNEAAKGQHLGSDHFANGKNGYSRVVAGAIPVD